MPDPKAVPKALFFGANAKHVVLLYRELHSKPKHLLRAFARPAIAAICCIAEYPLGGIFAAVRGALHGRLLNGLCC
jgi:hypothetical protein